MLPNAEEGVPFSCGGTTVYLFPFWLSALFVGIIPVCCNVAITDAVTVFVICSVNVCSSNAVVEFEDVASLSEFAIVVFVRCPCFLRFEG